MPAITCVKCEREFELLEYRNLLNKRVSIRCPLCNAVFEILVLDMELLKQLANNLSEAMNIALSVYEGVGEALAGFKRAGFKIGISISADIIPLSPEGLEAENSGETDEDFMRKMKIRMPN